MKNFWNILTICAWIFALIIGIILVYQILRIIFGGSWSVEDVILALVMVNVTLTSCFGGYLFSLNNKISQIDKKLYGHFEWHRGRDN